MNAAAVAPCREPHPPHRAVTRPYPVLDLRAMCARISHSIDNFEARLVARPILLPLLERERTGRSRIFGCTWMTSINIHSCAGCRPVRASFPIPAGGSKVGDGRRRKGLRSTYTVMYHVHASKHLRAGTALYNRILVFFILVSSCVCSGHCVVNMRELMNSRQAGRCRCCRARLQAAHTFDQNFAILAEFRR
jgi:hypothetical protein